MATDRIRAFIALDIPGNIRRVLQRLQDELRAAGVRARWVRPEKAHLTVRFLGDVPADAVAMVTAALNEAVPDMTAPELLLGNLGVFPDLRRARVVWAGLGGEVEALRKVKKRVDTGLEATDKRLFQVDNRAFKAHLTLGRFKGRVDGGRLFSALKKSAHFQAVPFTADTLVLFRSELTPRGPVYTPLAQWVLKTRHRDTGKAPSPSTVGG